MNCLAFYSILNLSMELFKNAEAYVHYCLDFLNSQTVVERNQKTLMGGNIRN